MNITYARDQYDHCEVSDQIREVTISTVKPAHNSDNLENIRFEEVGWNIVSQKGLHHPGKKVVFIPPESLVPLEFSDLIGVTSYLSKGRVKVVRLRGNRSEGLIIDKSIVDPYIPYILKWEDLPSAMSGEALSMKEVNPQFVKFYKMPNILNEPLTFDIGQVLHYSEKIHGTNFRIAKLPHPKTSVMTLYVGSHNVVLKDTGNDIYWRAAKLISDRIPENILFVGEIYGRGIMQLNYDTNFAVRIFAAIENCEYLSPCNLTKICMENNLPCVEFKELIYVDIEQLRTIADSPSEYTSKHIREGAVFISAKDSRRMAKCIGFEYLNSKNRIERH